MSFLLCFLVYISIHAPHEGERQTAPFEWRGEKIFQSTLPTRGSDYKDRTKYTAPTPISIHAPHEGERPLNHRLNFLMAEFQSTLPTRGSDGANTSASAIANHFNPRSPRGGATLPAQHRRRGYRHFNPRSPRGGATILRAAISHRMDNFNPRSPRGGATFFPKLFPVNI